jgi:hypothetical protein
MDVTAELGLAQRAWVFASIQNATDVVYVAARRPAGVRPGMPRQFIAGLKFDLWKEHRRWHPASTP